MTKTRNKAVLWFGIMGALVSFPVIFAFHGLQFWKTPQPSDIPFEKYELAGPKTRLRVRAFGEVYGGFAPGAYYRYEALNPHLNKWTEIMMVRHDDPVPIKKDSLQWVNSDVAYVYMGWKFAVTTNGGEGWTVWDGSRHKEIGQDVNYELIKTVAIREDGNGEMILQVLSPSSINLKLYTTDFGHTWSDAGV